MGEEEEEKGEWWLKLEKDMEKYKIGSKVELKQIFNLGQLKKVIESEHQEQDRVEKSALSEAQPAID